MSHIGHDLSAWGLLCVEESLAASDKQVPFLCASFWQGLHFAVRIYYKSAFRSMAAHMAAATARHMVPRSDQWLHTAAAAAFTSGPTTDNKADTHTYQRYERVYSDFWA